MDLSKLTDEELKALSEGRLDALSDQTLAMLQQSPAAAPSESASALKAAQGGATQAATMGYAPEITGGIAAGIGKLQDYFNPMINVSSGEPIPRVNYVQARDATKRELDKMAADQPAAYYGANIAGNMATGAGLAKAVGGVNTIGRGMALGAGMGAVQNPGSEEGVIDPVQPLERMGQAGLGAALGGIAGGMGKFVNRSTAKMNMYDKLQSGGASDDAKAAIDAAMSQAKANVLAPASRELDEALAGKKFNINADLVEKVFPQYGRALSKRAVPDEMIQSVYGAPRPGGANRVDISGQRLRDLKQMADKVADYGNPNKPFAASKPGRVSASEGAVKLGNKARELINSDPKAAKLNQVMADASKKLQAVEASSQGSPLEALTRPIGSTGRDVIKQLDTMAGSNLDGYGQLITDAAGMAKGGIEDLAMPLRARPEMLRLMELGAAKSGRALGKNVPITGNTVAPSLYEALRRK